MAVIFVFVFTMALILASCGGQKAEQGKDTSECLAVSFQEIGAQRTSEPKIYAGESLWEYINGGAEIYHQYNFEEVAMAYYEIDSEEIVADIYKFSGSENAYGLYTTVRPDNPVIESLGIGGFASSNSLTFVKGEFVVRLTSMAAGEGVENLLLEMGQLLESCLSGTADRPIHFANFPENGAIDHTDKYFSASFQGQAFLTEFFVQNYQLDGDTVTLFMSLSDAQSKLSQWQEAVTMMGAEPIEFENAPFAEGQYLATETFYGIVLAGLKNDRLVGMINYSDRHRQFLAEWVNSLP
jgi:hypothetical protein